jgi:DNA-binding LacI/PurR family transcriptional regulator
MPLPSLPPRVSLAAQVAACLRTAITEGRWREWLPAERALAETLHVSRCTLRLALEQLAREGTVRAEHGAGHRILAARPARAAAPSRDVALLTPEPLERLRPWQTLWIDELRALLAEQGGRLSIIPGRAFGRDEPGPALARLVRQRPHGCWVLLLASAGCQRWFAQRAIPAVVAGTCHEGVDLPYRDLDHRATCRHAAGLLLGRGHRRIALVCPRTRFAGDLESEVGFLEGVSRGRHDEAKGVICRHDGTPAGLLRALGLLMGGPARPTGLVVVNAHHSLTVVSGLARQGWRVPEDVSVLSRDDDPFLSFLVPPLARYAAQPREFARSVVRPVMELLEGGPAAVRAAWSMPRFESGASVASLRSP